ncbi:MAG: prolipoprotein diacylglyceryl transferase [Planctomycetes bacterium]|jgi:phosphatidylglycerol:prolipoprotein diacylglycerol transferase|nr:prolipoprotein diacylglyceryl transferase [Planctomycetota bacterium]HNZ65957.1 prolipoprotein diacylglyceryl transferase [Planctomycetota bacterium]HPY75061.1 prolipoprotein diacylglyceryl transferase [Planctomycetota bacterium]HQB00722.1 prolipoprotein diacylglyceryl transferase [Planctomycetota bacterium]
MKPILFHIGSYPIYGYGLMFGLAFIVCLFIGKIRFKEQKFSDNLAYDFIIIILLASLIGARAFFVFQHTELFDFSLFHIFEKINLWAIIPTCLVAVALYYNTKSIEPITIAFIITISIKYTKTMAVQLGYFYIFDFLFLGWIGYYAYKNYHHAKIKFLEQTKIKKIIHIGFIILLFFILSRFLHCYLYWEQYDWSMFAFWQSGLVFYGGFLLSCICLIIYMYIKKLPFLKILDICTFCFVIGLSIGRLGCYLNGCCYGQSCPDHTITAVQFPADSIVSECFHLRGINIQQLQKQYLPSQYQHKLSNHSILQALEKHMPADTYHHFFRPVYPTQIYSALSAILIYFILLLFHPRRKYDGETFFLLLILYSAMRFIMETYRVEPFIGNTGLTIAQFVCIPIFIISTTIFLTNRITPFFIRNNK